MRNCYAKIKNNLTQYCQFLFLHIIEVFLSGSRRSWSVPLYPSSGQILHLRPPSSEHQQLKGDWNAWLMPYVRGSIRPFSRLHSVPGIKQKGELKKKIVMGIEKSTIINVWEIIETSEIWVTNGYCFTNTRCHTKNCFLAHDFFFYYIFIKSKNREIFLRIYTYIFRTAMSLSLGTRTSGLSPRNGDSSVTGK